MKQNKDGTVGPLFDKNYFDSQYINHKAYVRKVFKAIDLDSIRPSKLEHLGSSADLVIIDEAHLNTPIILTDDFYNI